VNYHYHCHFPGLAFVYVAESIEGLPSEGGGCFRILKMVIFLENYIGTDDWQCRYIRGRCSYTSYWSRKRSVPYGELVGACGLGSIVGIITGYELDGLGIEF